MRLDYLDKDCISKIREAAKDERFDKDKFLAWLERKNVAGKNNPSAYFAAVFRSELLKGTFYKGDDLSDIFGKEEEKETPIERKELSVEEYLHMFEGAEDFPEPVSDKDEMNQDEARKLMWEGAVKTLGGDKPFHEPIPQDEREGFINGLYPEYVRDGYRRHPEYFENTWITVYRESRERGEPMRKTCERKGLKLEALIV